VAAREAVLGNGQISAMTIVVMGVSGSGKTTIGTMLADAIQCPFLEGDSLHSRENIDKMSRGVPLADSDRAPWLAAIRDRIVKFFKRGENLVVGCSALKQEYREFIARDIPITWVYLKGSAELIRSRLKHRSSHFMKASMLASQFEVLEEPSEAIVIDVSPPPRAIVEEILARLRKPGPIPEPGAANQNAQNRHAQG
jgi:gluconokinase